VVRGKQLTADDFYARLPCESSSVPKARAAVRDWCRETQMRSDAITDVQLAVTEAVANAVRHSGCDDFEVKCSIRAGSAIICVCDHGTGLDGANPGLGLGITIIRELAESVEFEHTNPGTRVTMRFDRRASHRGT
jgi:serine/threonine-protein kinase RsbW